MPTKDLVRISIDRNGANPRIVVESVMMGADGQPMKTVRNLDVDAKAIEMVDPADFGERKERKDFPQPSVPTMPAEEGDLGQSG